MKFLLDSIFSYHYHLGSVFSNFECTTHELIYFISGEGEIICNHGKIAYKANHIHFSKKGDIKSATCFKKTSYICLRFFGEIESTGIISGVFPCSDDELLKIFLDIQKEYRQQKSDYYELCNIKLVELYAVFGLALIAKEEGRYEDAIQNFTSLLQLKFRNYKLYIELANSYLKTNQKNLAIEVLEIAQKRGFKGTDINEMLIGIKQK